MLTSTDDWLNLVWALKSYYRATTRQDALCIHDDGSLPAVAIETLRQHFPNARLIDRVTANAEVLSALIDFPHCAEFRRTNHLAPKVFDFRQYLAADRMLLLDSDVLFFEAPMHCWTSWRIPTPDSTWSTAISPRPTPSNRTTSGGWPGWS